MGRRKGGSAQVTTVPAAAAAAMSKPQKTLGIDQNDRFVVRGQEKIDELYGLGNGSDSESNYEDDAADANTRRRGRRGGAKNGQISRGDDDSNDNGLLNEVFPLDGILNSSDEDGKNSTEEEKTDDDDDDEQVFRAAMGVVAAKERFSTDARIGNGFADAGEDDDEDEPGWGQHKSSYYKKDDETFADEEAAQLEEHEARRLAAARMMRLTVADFAPTYSSTAPNDDASSDDGDNTFGMEDKNDTADEDDNNKDEEGRRRKMPADVRALISECRDRLGELSNSKMPENVRQASLLFLMNACFFLASARILPQASRVAHPVVDVLVEAVAHVQAAEHDCELAEANGVVSDNESKNSSDFSSCDSDQDTNEKREMHQESKGKNELDEDDDLESSTPSGSECESESLTDPESIHLERLGKRKRQDSNSTQELANQLRLSILGSADSARKPLRKIVKGLLASTKKSAPSADRQESVRPRDRNSRQKLDPKSQAFYDAEADAQLAMLPTNLERNQKKRDRKREQKIRRLQTLRAAGAAADAGDGNDAVSAISGSKRAASKTILLNKGLTPSRPKENRNPRIKLRNKYADKLKKLKTVQRQVRTQTGAYGGEFTGIKTHLTRSVKLQ